jgi:hypothetical protein
VRAYTDIRIKRVGTNRRRPGLRKSPGKVGLRYPAIVLLRPDDEFVPKVRTGRISRPIAKRPVCRDSGNRPRPHDDPADGNYTGRIAAY